LAGDPVLAAVTLYVGVVFVALGLYNYFGRGAEGVWRRAEANMGGAFWLPTILLFTPLGLASMLFGVALAVGKNWFTDYVVMTAVALLGLGLVHIFVHPKWSQPKWMRVGAKQAHAHRKARR
jgi:hypothetical protein